MAYNELIDGTLTVAGTQTAAGTAFSGTVTTSGALSLRGNLVSNSGTTSATGNPAGATTFNGIAGRITTENVTQAPQGTYSLAISNTAISNTDVIFASVANGTNTGGAVALGTVLAATGKVTIAIVNALVTGTSFNGTMVVTFLALK